MFGDMFPQSRGFVTMPVTSRIKDIWFKKSLSNNSEGRRNCPTFGSAWQRNRDSQETCTKYKHLRKLMLVFLEKFENRGIKIGRVNSIRNT